MRIYINKIENRIPFKIKSGYYLELLTSVEGIKKKITKDKNS